MVGRVVHAAHLPKGYRTEKYVTDVSLPNMLHARVVRPTRAGCTVASVDESSVKKVKGARVVREKDFVAVLAAREWDAVRASRTLKVDWNHVKTSPFPPMAEIYDHIRRAPVDKREEPVKKGDVAAIFKTAAKVVEAEYEWPFQSHASMGPACAVADVRAEGVTVWSGSQKPHFVQLGVSRLLDLPPEKVHVIWVTGPGSYGRNDAGDAALDAAKLSKIAGRPVRVQGMRQDGIAWDPKGPASVHRGRAALDASGKVIGYEFVSKGFSRINIATNESDPRNSLVGMSTGLPPKHDFNFGTPAETYAFGTSSSPGRRSRRCSIRARRCASHLRDGQSRITSAASSSSTSSQSPRARPVAPSEIRRAPRDAAVIKAAAEGGHWPRARARALR